MGQLTRDPRVTVTVFGSAAQVEATFKFLNSGAAGSAAIA